jgi:SSS family solute:Na+ symporter
LVIPHELQGNYSLALPLMFIHYYPAGWLGLGITALLASFMSGMAGNITAFNTVWTYDLYQSYIMPNRSDHHYLVVGRMVTVVGTVISIGAAYTALGFRNIFDYWALVSTIFVGAPFATFVMGVFTRRLNGTAAFVGMLVGILASVFHYALYRVGYLNYGSDLAMGFYGGFYGFLANLIVALIGSRLEAPRPPEELRGLVYSGAFDLMSQTGPWYRTPLALAVIAAGLVILLNFLFW